MADFLLELRSEEIPARMQAKARDDLARIFSDVIGNSQIVADSIQTFSTPRRLALIARGLPEQTPARREERKGPRADAPAAAISGFLKSVGLERDQLEERADAKGNMVLFAVKQAPGRPTAEALREALFVLISDFPWPKSMRWGEASLSTESLRWVRPLQGIVALLGEEVVPFEIAGIASGSVTLGHRFHHPGAITIGSAADYVEKLRACHVLVDQDERAAIIRDGAAKLAADAGLELIADEGLVAENAGLTEWPVPLLGRFDEAFLTVPPEVIQLTARVNQKYFVCRDTADALANAFICTANMDAADGGGRIVEGNRKVLAARLADAKFFYETDLETPLDVQAAKLGQIVFHEKLGTVADKVERVAKLARWLVEEGIVRGADPDMAERAARLAKADLVTGMVGEFPELQGLMGGYYAAAQGEPQEVAAAIRNHYKPVGQGDDVPTDPVTVAVSLADKLDTIAGFFLIGEKPTGSKDPFALRRAALGVLEIVTTCDIRMETMHFFARAAGAYGRQLEKRPENQVEYEEGLGKLFTVEFYGAVTDFIFDRLKVQQRANGVRHDLVDAVFAVGDDQPIRLLARVKALQAFVETEDGGNLLTGYRRAANILKKEGWDEARQPNRHPGFVPGSDEQQAQTPAENWMPEQVRHDDLGYTPEPTEAALIVALDAAAPAAADAVARENFEGAMAALATLRAPIDAFFDQVTVNDADPAKRTARLALLARIREAVHGVADFSKIEG